MRCCIDALRVIRELNARSSGLKKYDVYEKAITRQRRELEKVNRKFSELYGDYSEHLINESEYLTLKQQYLLKSEALKKEIDNLLISQNLYSKNYKIDADWENLINKYLKCRKLNKELADAFVDKVQVFEGGRISVNLVYDDCLEELLQVKNKREFERFSRSNRASTQRIANLIIQVPSVSEQQKLVDEIEAIDKRIADEQAIISEQSAKVKSKFVEMFGDNPATTHGKNSVKLSTLCENLDNERKPITEHLRNKGDIPYYGASGIVDYVAEYIFDETLLLISEDGANLVSRNMPIAFSITGKSWVNNHVHILRFKNYKLQKYVESYINNIDLSEYINKNANPKLTQEKLNSIMIYMPNDTTLDLYISSINQCDKLKFEAQERLEELNAAREDIIDKYFR